MARKGFDNPAIDYLDSRLPIPSMLRWLGKEHPYPKNLSYWWNFGSLSGVMLMIMIITGIFLAMPLDTGDTYRSIRESVDGIPGYHIMQKIHMVGASFFFIVVYFHIFRGLYYGSYKGPREMVWWIGLVIYVLMMGTAFMGYTIVNSDMSVGGAKVITDFFTVIPFIGEDVRAWLLGGNGVTDVAIKRFFVIHFLLPFVIVGMVLFHLLALFQVGSNNPLGVDMKGPQDSISFHPYYTVKDLFGLAVFLTIFMFVVFYLPFLLGEPEGYQTGGNPSHVVPEWYFLHLFAILRSFTFDIGIPFTDIVLLNSKELGVIFMGLALVVPFFLPMLDRNPARSTKFRPIYRWFFWLFVVVCVLLGQIGLQDTAANAAIYIPAFSLVDWWTIELPVSVVTFGLLLTAYFFAHFLIVLPVLSVIETPRQLPASIAQPVMRHEGQEASNA